MGPANGGAVEALRSRQFYEEMIRDRGADSVLVEIAVAQGELRDQVRALRAAATASGARWLGRGGAPVWAIVEIVGILVAASVVSLLSSRLTF